MPTGCQIQCSNPYGRDVDHSKGYCFHFLKIPAKQCLVISNSFEVLLCREIAGRCSTGCHPQRFHSRMLTCFHHSPYIVPHHPTSRGVYGNHHHSLNSVVNQHPLSAASTVEYCFPPALAKIQLASSMETVGVGGSPAFAWQWLAGSSNQLGCSEMFQHNIFDSSSVSYGPVFDVIAPILTQLI